MFWKMRLSRCAAHYRQVCSLLGIPLVFKASYDKANRSSIYSYKGPGLREGLLILQAVIDKCGFPVITDVHSSEEAAVVAEVAEIIQLHASLLEDLDRLEQLRLIEPGLTVAIFRVKGMSLSVDTSEQLEQARQLLSLIHI